MQIKNLKSAFDKAEFNYSSSPLSVEPFKLQIQLHVGDQLKKGN